MENIENNAQNNQTPSQPTLSAEEIRQQRLLTIGLVVGGIILLSILAGVIYYLLLDSSPTATIRDIMIIFMAFELSLIGLMIVILAVQIAKLVNLLQNEVKPVLDAANETMNTVRGTATFISDAMVEPVMKLNGWMAAARRLLDLVNFNNS